MRRGFLDGRGNTSWPIATRCACRGKASSQASTGNADGFESTGSERVVLRGTVPGSARIFIERIRPSMFKAGQDAAVVMARAVALPSSPMMTQLNIGATVAVARPLAPANAAPDHAAMAAINKRDTKLARARRIASELSFMKSLSELAPFNERRNSPMTPNRPDRERPATQPGRSPSGPGPQRSRIHARPARRECRRHSCRTGPLSD